MSNSFSISYQLASTTLNRTIHSCEKYIDDYKEPLFAIGTAASLCYSPYLFAVGFLLGSVQKTVIERELTHLKNKIFSSQSSNVDASSEDNQKRTFIITKNKTEILVATALATLLYAKDIGSKFFVFAPVISGITAGCAYRNYMDSRATSN